MTIMEIMLIDIIHVKDDASTCEDILKVVNRSGGTLRCNSVGDTEGKRGDIDRLVLVFDFWTFHSQLEFMYDFCN